MFTRLAGWFHVLTNVHVLSIILVDEQEVEEQHLRLTLDAQQLRPLLGAAVLSVEPGEIII